MNYFPKFYDDECLYSLKARLLRDTLSNSDENRCNYLGEVKNHVISLDLPSHVGELYEATKHIVKWTMESIIEDHTIFPVYRPFLSEEKRIRIVKSMISDRIENIQSIAGINSSNLVRSRFPKFCPICGLEDLGKYGEPYWHRIHQFPNIQVCPDHNCLLVEYEPKAQELKGFKYFVLTESLVNNSVVTHNRCGPLEEIGKQLNDLLHRKGTFDIKDVKYLNCIINKGYYRNGQVLRKDVQIEFQNYYKGVFNEYLRERISESYDWIGNIINQPEKVFNPYQHLLFQNFIESLDFRSFPPKKENPFGNGPWKCFNKTSDHYLKDVITELTLKKDEKNNRMVGIFKCSCGMVYSKYFTHKGEIVKENIRVKKRGEAWDRKLHECILNQLSLRETAGILGTNAATISKMLRKKTSKGRYDISGLVSSKRKEWEIALSEFSEDSYCESRKKFPALYKWLFRYDRDWLMSTRPSQKRNNGSQFRLDWDQIDNNLLAEINETVTRLKTENLNFRVSKTLIGKLVKNGKYILSTNMNRLPKSNNYLLMNTDSIADFQIKKIEKASDAIYSEGRSMTKG
ncbi:MAG: TnsD family Tn7-like transposition protein, partial [Cyclobacteriaceae bacterium]